MNFDALDKMFDDMDKMEFGLKRYSIFEPETHWNMKVTAKNPEQARSKAWVQGGWDKLPFTHCKKEAFEVREL